MTHWLDDMLVIFQSSPIHYFTQNCWLDDTLAGWHIGQMTHWSIDPLVSWHHRLNSIYRSTTRFLPGFLHRNQTKYYRIECFLFHKPVQVEVTSWAYKTGFWCKQYKYVSGGGKRFVDWMIIELLALIFAILTHGNLNQCWFTYQ